jgi:hypothetical protein
MIPYDLDPSLHSGEPEPPRMDDGFSPPRQDAARARDDERQALPEPPVPPAPGSWAKSAF